MGYGADEPKQEKTTVGRESAKRPRDPKPACQVDRSDETSEPEHDLEPATSSSSKIPSLSIWPRLAAKAAPNFGYEPGFKAVPEMSLILLRIVALTAASTAGFELAGLLRKQQHALRHYRCRLFG